MGDRADCTLIVFGETTEAAFEKLVWLCDDQADEKIDPEHDRPNHWEFGQVNYGVLRSDIKAEIKKAGLSYIWLNGGDNYQAGVELWSNDLQAKVAFMRQYLDLLTIVRDPKLNEARYWQEFLDKGFNAEVTFTDSRPVYEVTLWCKVTYTAEVHANSEDEAIEMVKEMVAEDEVDGVSQGYSATLAHIREEGT